MKWKILTYEHLKILACLLMLLDHIGYLRLVPGYYTELRTIGRLAFPIFCFLLCQGFTHTHSKRTYLIRLGIGMLLAEIPFDLFSMGQFSFAKQSVMVTLFAGFLMAMLMERVEKPQLKPLLLIPFYFFGQLLRSDYGGAGIAMVAVFLLTENVPHKLIWQTVLLFMASFLVDSWKLHFFGISFPIQIFCIFAMIPIALYNGRKTTHSPAVQWGFYLFYPAHMLILYLFR